MIEVTCRPFLTAYTPRAVDETRALWLPADRYRPFDENADPRDPRFPVQIIELDIPGNDGTPMYVDPGCGRKFQLDDLGPITGENEAICVPASRWDVNVERDSLGFEHVIERHLDARCPFCGRVADHLSVPVDRQLRNEWSDAMRDREMEQAFGQAYRDASDDLKFAARMGWMHYFAEVNKWMPVIQGGSDAGYNVMTEANVALSAATAKTILGVKAHANSGCSWLDYSISFDGISASAVPAIVELCYLTWATNSPGTSSSSGTVQQKYGRVLTAGFTTAYAWSSEPTAVTVKKVFHITPNGGSERWAEPLGTELDTALAEGFAIRVTAPATVNCRADMLTKRI